MTLECQEKNAKGLTMAAVGMNKAADELVILDERTREELANGRYQDQRRGTFGPLPRAPRPEAGAGTARPETGAGTPRPEAGAGTPRPEAGAGTAGPAGRSARPAQPQPARRTGARPARPPWTSSQEKLALLYNQQGRRPDEIAQKLGISRYMVTQIILGARNRGKG